MSTLDLLTLVSFTALNVDIIFQVRKVYKTKSSRDLSLIGMGTRYAAILMILVKFISLSDTVLIIGQGLLVFTFTIYLMLSVYYYIHREYIFR